MPLCLNQITPKSSSPSEKVREEGSEAGFVEHTVSSKSPQMNWVEEWINEYLKPGTL